MQGGLYNGLMRALQTLGLADAFGASRIPILALNVVYPLVPEEISGFCADKRAVLVLEEGQPEFIEQEIATFLRRADVQARLHGKDCMHMAGEYNVEALVRGIAKFLAQHAPHLDISPGCDWVDDVAATEEKAIAAARRAAGAPADLLRRLPGAAGVLGDEARGAGHRPAARLDGRRLPCLRLVRALLAGQHAARLRHEPRLGGRRGVDAAKRPVAIMGDGGFWHNGLLTGRRVEPA